MTTPVSNSQKWISVASGLLLVAAFFIPWVNWDGNALSGMNLPDGKFFSASEKLGQGNPFPQFDFAMAAFWLVPVLGLAVVALALANKRSWIIAALAGIIPLSQATIYFCFSDLLINQLGYVTTPLSSVFNIGFYATIIGAVGIIIASVPAKAWVKILLIIIGPLVTWGGFKVAGNYLESKGHADTADVKADYTVAAPALLAEFKNDETGANKKYQDKIVTVTDIALTEEVFSKINVSGDSSATVEVPFGDEGYIIFAFEGKDVKAVSALQKDSATTKGQKISIKGSSSGGSGSILGISIQFKRSTINKQ
jgi:hypothetical protein